MLSFLPVKTYDGINRRGRKSACRLLPVANNSVYAGYAAAGEQERLGIAATGEQARSIQAQLLAGQERQIGLTGGNHVAHNKSDLRAKQV
jgi:hypothetical protein